ncbi:acylphosphatase [Mesorhizobium abyssinicae]|uniref:acylphosphatase n=1 Tax=Mesorhizobium abyssinicae TaxID=1209958 RepID=UPI0033997298
MKVSMGEQTLRSSRERMTILGDVEAASFVPWIERHASKLGLAQAICAAGPDRIELDIAGPAELIDMMEMGCSLGPIDVWVEAIRRAPIESESG